MRALAPPFRFVLGVLGLWIGARVAILLPHTAREAASGLVGTAEAAAPSADAGRFVASRAASSSFAASPADRDRLAPALGPSIERERAARRLMWLAVRDMSTRRMSFARYPPELPRPGEPAPLIAPATASRWAVSAYVYARGGGGGTTALAGGGQLGGSQASARITYRLNRDGPVRLALAARVSTPLASTKGTEAAAGIDWHPLPKLPLRLSIERRIDLGGEGRNAWSAYAAGGFHTGSLPGGLEADGYAQAGVVGASRRDLFADGAVRVAKALRVETAMLRVAAAAWGAAQPGASRLDIGPRVALTLPAGKGSVTAALDYRVRVAGHARPGSGVAFTLSTDF